MAGIGFDCGTYNLVSSKRDSDGNFSNKREINAFLEIPLENRFVFEMMKTAGVPLIERGDVGYALGEAAVNMAYTMSTLELKRPMSAGCVNPKEKDAFQILNIMIHSLIGEPSKDKELLYYSVPANAINEALALVYAELGKKAFTGVGVSCGAGMVNVCYAMYGNPIFQFAIVNSGDWIDKQSAKATGETPTFINKEKTKVDLAKAPTNLVERAIQTQYRIMIENTVTEIKKGLANAGKSVHSDVPVDIIVAGGTSSPPGFDKLFRDTVMQANLPIKVGDVIRPEEPLYSVAKGCLIAAEAANK